MMAPCQRNLPAKDGLYKYNNIVQAPGLEGKCTGPGLGLIGLAFKYLVTIIQIKTTVHSTVQQSMLET